MTKIKDSDIDMAKRLEEKECSLTQKRYEDMTLPELLETRDNIKRDRLGIERMGRAQGTPDLFKFAMARLQKHIHHKRTHRSSGLIIPYNKDIDYD